MDPSTIKWKVNGNEEREKTCISGLESHTLDEYWGRRDSSGLATFCERMDPFLTESSTLNPQENAQEDAQERDRRIE